MGTIVGFKEVTVSSDNGTSEGCISITSKSYKCIDISSFVPQCITISSELIEEIIIPTPNLSCPDFAGSNESVEVTINNYNADFNYNIYLSINGGSINLVSGGKFNWVMPSFQDPQYYPNTHMVSVYASKNGEVSLGGFHEITVVGFFVRWIPESRNFIKPDGLYTEFEWDNVNPESIIFLHELKDPSGSVVDSGYASGATPSLRINPKCEWNTLYDSQNFTYEISAIDNNDPEGAIISTEVLTIPFQKQDMSAVVTGVPSSMIVGQIVVLSLEQYIETFNYLIDAQDKISVSINAGEVTITALLEGAGGFTIICQNPIRTECKSIQSYSIAVTLP